MEKKVLNYEAINAFNSWFLRRYSLCIMEPKLTDFITTTCFNKRLGVLIASFGYDFVRPFLDGSLHLDKKAIKLFERRCPLSYAQRETLNGLLYGHLRACEYCRHVNSVHVYEHLSATHGNIK